MPESFYDTIVILFFTVIPLSLLILHILLSTRKKLVWGTVIPILWTALGAWILMTRYYRDQMFSYEFLIFFLAGDVILIGTTILLRYWRKNKK